MMKGSLRSNYCQTLKPISCGMVDQEVILKVRFKLKTFEIFPRKDFFILVEKFCQRYRTYKVRTPISHIQLECYHEFGFEKLSITVVDVEFSRRLETHLDCKRLNSIQKIRQRRVDCKFGV